MREGLARWARWVPAGATEAQFVEAAETELAGLEQAVVDAVHVAAPFAPCYAGLKRCWQLAATDGYGAPV